MIDTERLNSGSSLKVKDSEEIYIDLLKGSNIHYESHVTRFTSKLFLHAPFLEKRLVRKTVIVAFKDTIDQSVYCTASEPDAFIRSINEVASPIREMMSKVSNKSETQFRKNSQINSVPIELLTLVSILIDGADISKKTFSQAAVTSSQQIMYNFQKNKRKKCVEGTRHLRQRETPSMIYVSLKIFAVVRSKNLIQHLFSLGICIPYSRVLDIKELSDRLLQQYEQDEVFLPEVLRVSYLPLLQKIM